MNTSENSIRIELKFFMSCLGIASILMMIFHIIYKENYDHLNLIKNYDWDKISIKINDQNSYDSFQGKTAYTLLLPTEGLKRLKLECNFKLRELCKKVKNEKNKSTIHTIHYYALRKNQANSTSAFQVQAIDYLDEDLTKRSVIYNDNPPNQTTNIKKQQKILWLVTAFGLLISLISAFIISILKISPKKFRISLILIIFSYCFYSILKTILITL